MTTAATKQFILNDKRGDPAYKAVVDVDSHHATANAYFISFIETLPDGTDVPTWEEKPCAQLFLKWDGCTELSLEQQHRCSGEMYLDTLMMMRWLWDISAPLIEAFSEEPLTGTTKELP